MPKVLKAEEQIRRARQLGWDRGGFVKIGKSLTYSDTFISNLLKREYSLVVDWRPGKREARISSPIPLPTRQIQLIPHLHDQTLQTVCLFRNVKGCKVEFDDSMPIIETLILWLYEWIDTYEYWLISGIWQFPEHEHLNTKQ